jgi:hypothetical protein
MAICMNNTIRAELFKKLPEALDFMQRLET